MTICKHYVLGKCTRDNCKFEHIDNICRNYFFGECTRNNCKFSHEFKLSNGSNGSNEGSKKHNNNHRKIIKNTESFTPRHQEPSIRILFNDNIRNGNEISIHDNLFSESDCLYEDLLNEIDNDIYKPWHGNTHLIADDSHYINWKQENKYFEFIVKQLCKYFCMTPGATRVNYYSNEDDWKPYHHDSAALKPEKAKTQNITVGLSLGTTREISFESTHYNTNERVTINFPLHNCTVYSFGNKVNCDFRHGIPQLSPDTINNDKFKYEGRISVIIWGYSSLIK